MRTKKLLISVLALCLSVSMAFAAGTPAGTEITNQAFGTYYDTNENPYEAESEVVTTTVSQKAGVDLAPKSQSKDILFGGTEAFSLTLTNAGNKEDKFIIELSYDEAGGAENTAKIYGNPNNDPAYIEGTHVELQKEDGKYETPLVGHESATENFHMFVVVENVSGAARSTNVVSITATSEYSVEEEEDPLVSEIATITTTVLRPKMDISFSVDPTSAIPVEDVVEFTFNLENTGNANASSLEAEIVFPVGITYAPGSTMLYVGEGDGTVITDDNENSIAGVGEPEMIITATSSGITIFVENFNYNDDSGDDSYYGKITYKATVNSDVPSTTVIENKVTGSYTNETKKLEESFSKTANLTVNESIGVAFEDGSDPEDFYTPKDTVIYTVTLKNYGNATYTFNITHNDDLEWKWKIYDSEDNLIEDPIEIEAFQSVDLTVASRVPVGTSDEATNELTLTATNTDAPSDKATTTFTVTVAAPILSLTKLVNGSTDQNSAKPGDTMTYTVIVANTGTGLAKTIRISDLIPQFTTYVNGSMKHGELELPDNFTDQTAVGYLEKDGEKVTKVFFRLDEIQSEASHTFSFEVTID